MFKITVYSIKPFSAEKTNNCHVLETPNFKE